MQCEYQILRPYNVSYSIFLGLELNIIAIKIISTSLTLLSLFYLRSIKITHLHFRILQSESKSSYNQTFVQFKASATKCLNNFYLFRKNLKIYSIPYRLLLNGTTANIYIFFGTTKMSRALKKTKTQISHRFSSHLHRKTVHNFKKKFKP